MDAWYGLAPDEHGMHAEVLDHVGQNERNGPPDTHKRTKGERGIAMLKEGCRLALPERRAVVIQMSPNSGDFRDALGATPK